MAHKTPLFSCDNDNMYSLLYGLCVEYGECGMSDGKCLIICIQDIASLTIKVPKGKL
jgi:hypothetical protein